MLGLQELHLQQTLLRGALPDALGELPYLMVVDIRNTLMTCCNSTADADALIQSAVPRGASPGSPGAFDGLLPQYVRFSDPPLWETPARLDSVFFNFTLRAAQPTGASDPGENMQ
jgi:hypothetical protein